MCGAALDTGRWDDGPGIGQRAGSWFGAITRGGLPLWVVWGVVILAVAFAYGLLG